jgi:hypothetical protein
MNSVTSRAGHDVPDDGETWRPEDRKCLPLTIGVESRPLRPICGQAWFSSFECNGVAGAYGADGAGRGGVWSPAGRRRSAAPRGALHQVRVRTRRHLRRDPRTRLESRERRRPPQGERPQATHSHGHTDVVTVDTTRWTHLPFVPRHAVGGPRRAPRRTRSTSMSRGTPRYCARVDFLQRDSRLVPLERHPVGGDRDARPPHAVRRGPGPVPRGGRAGHRIWRMGRAAWARTATRSVRHGVRVPQWCRVVLCRSRVSLLAQSLAIPRPRNEVH